MSDASDNAAASSTAAVTHPVSKRSLLFICDEWLPEHGGISTFNRAFSRACAERGHRTACLVNQATDMETADAMASGVTLLQAYQSPDGPQLLVPTVDTVSFGADTVIGHDRITGSVAHTYALNHLKARLVHIIHTAPSEIEWFKGTGRAAERAEE